MQDSLLAAYRCVTGNYVWLSEKGDVTFDTVVNRSMIKLKCMTNQIQMGAAKGLDLKVSLLGILQKRFSHNN